MSKAKKILKQVFGYEDFRPLQEQIIENVLARKDTLVIMPTGGGKSICYQIPALIMEGLTVVISPLISLMKDQVEQLRAVGVEAACLNSSLAAQEYSENFAMVKSGQARLLYVAPETLLTARIGALLDSVQVDCFTIDEAHCISEWGHDFRPEYRQLVQVRTRYPKAVCIALTATATPRVRKDIISSLGFQTSMEFIASFNRPNLLLRVVPKASPVMQAIEFLKGFSGRSGIIYCISRKQGDELAEILAQEKFSVLPYHAGLEDWERKRNQERFIRDEVQIIVATIAFGMGINKPNVRFILHFDLPQNIESYYQQIGRAGRDGLRAECLLLFGYGDILKINYFIEQKEGSEHQIAKGHLAAMISYAETELCRRTPLLEYFGEESNKACGTCDNCIEPKQTEDLSVPAQMFLSCVKRTGERFGAHHIVDVLRGSESQKILSFGHQHLSTYGIGKQYDRSQWLHLSRQFLQKKLLVQEAQFGGLQLAEKAHEVLSGREKILGRLAEVRVKAKTKELLDLDYDTELFELLKKRRKTLADRDNGPPYVIFPDRTLVEMATYFPQSENSLLTIHGVGQAKLKKYGPRFLDDIVSFCKRREIKEIDHGRAAQKPRPKKAANTRSLLVGRAFNSGQHPTEIAAENGVAVSTVLNHLHTCLQQKTELNTDRSADLRALCSCSHSQQEDALAAFGRFGIDLLKPVYENLHEQVSYDDLRILRLCYLIEGQTSPKQAPD